MAGLSREINEIIVVLRKQGFDVTKANNGHWRVQAPDRLGGKRIQIAATPRNPRSVLNEISRLKRIGYKPPKK